jgi:hypothetical protein
MIKGKFDGRLGYTKGIKINKAKDKKHMDVLLLLLNRAI